MIHTFVLREERFVRRAINFIERSWKAAAAHDRPLAMTVTDAAKPRTLSQNKLFHALFAEIAEKAWVYGRQYDAETWKVFFAKRFIGTEEIVLPDGDVLERPISTTALSIEEGGRFIEAVQHYAVSELGIELEH